jgi:predicted transcriptional regulator YdeE
MTEIKQDIQTCGLEVELVTSQTENFKIIQNHWKVFNNVLKQLMLNQHGSNWTKYGITYKSADKYLYLTAIPVEHIIVPEHFILKNIPKGVYEVFTHRGKMADIKKTLFRIYREILPASALKVEDHKKAGFLHFEKYDSRFQWNKPGSVIDVYIPLDMNK